MALSTGRRVPCARYTSTRSVPAASVLQATPHRPRLHITMASEVEREVLAVNQRLLDAIAANDYNTYSQLCSPGLTCFEPESVGHLVTGTPFHKYYFDNLTPAAVDAAKPCLLNTMSSPKVHVMGGGNVAVLAYVRLVQKMVNGAPVTAQAQETRVWEKQDGKWIHVHFHKSA